MEAVSRELDMDRLRKCVNTWNPTMWYSPTIKVLISEDGENTQAVGKWYLTCKDKEADVEVWLSGMVTFTHGTEEPYSMHRIHVRGVEIAFVHEYVEGVNPWDECEYIEDWESFAQANEWAAENIAEILESEYRKNKLERE